MSAALVEWGRRTQVVRFVAATGAVPGGTTSTPTAAEVGTTALARLLFGKPFIRTMLVARSSPPA